MFVKIFVGFESELLCFFNIGGVFNFIYIDGDVIFVFDIGFGNVLLDDWVCCYGMGDYDDGGILLDCGSVDVDCLFCVFEYFFLVEFGLKLLDWYSFFGVFVDGFFVENGVVMFLVFIV